MLAQEVAARHPGRVRFVEENFGESALAERFGIEQYPAIFVDEALVAGPWDFFAWPDTPKGRYVPFLDPANRDRFAKDLERFVERRLAGETLSNTPRRSGAPPPALDALPHFEATTLSGESISNESLGGRIVLVEFWATWCPPCRSTLSFLATLEKSHRDEVAVLPIAVSSEEGEVKTLLAEMADEEGAPASAIMSTDEIVSAFGGVLAVPTLMVFGPDGRIEALFYGAPPDLDEKVERTLAAIAEVDR